MTRSLLCTAAFLAAVTPYSAAQSQVAVLTQHNDDARTGANLQETLLTPHLVESGHFGMRFHHAVDDQLYTQPLLVPAVKIGGGWHDVVYVTTVNNSVYAFDANDASSSTPFWHVNFGTPANVHDANFGCLDINGNMGIIGTPVIDVSRGALFVVALTRVRNGFEQRLHALDLATGADLPGSPRIIEAPGFDALMQNQRPALAEHGNKIFVGYASHCDKQPYHGFLISFDADSLQRLAVLNTSPGGEGASIWQSGQAPAIDARGNLYVVTGNGSWDGKSQFSESFLKLDENLRLLDWFTPTNHVQLDKIDADLDSSGATLIPGTPLVMGGGKQGVLYTLRDTRLGHLGDEHAVQHFQATSSHLHSLVFWNSAQNGPLLYLWGQRDRLRAYKLRGDHLDEQPFMSRTEVNEGHPGAMVSLSANGARDGIVWAAIHATGDSWHESRPGVLHAYAADDLSHELWNSLQTPGRDDCGNYSKMAPPTIANGKVFLASFGSQNTGTGQLCVYGALPSGAVPPAPQDVRAAYRDHFVELTWQPVKEAESYTVLHRVRGEDQVVAAGLVRPAYSDPGIVKGTATYAVVAVNANGQSLPSAPADVTVQKVPTQRMQH